MILKYNLIFDGVMIKQLKKLAKNKATQSILSKMFDKLEAIGPLAGDLLDSKLFIYEIKNKHPAIRLYFKHKQQTDEIHIFEYEIKKSEKKQKQTINKIRKKVSKT